MKGILAIAFLVCVAMVYSLDLERAVNCPPVNEENATLLPNPYCCECYFACETGKAIPMKCPDGLHFNPEVSVCDWPSNVNCEELEPPQ